MCESDTEYNRNASEGRAPFHLFMPITDVCELGEKCHEALLCFSDTDERGEVRHAFYTADAAIIGAAGGDAAALRGECGAAHELCLYNLLARRVERTVPTLFLGDIHVIAVPARAAQLAPTPDRGNAGASVADAERVRHVPSGRPARRLTHVEGVSHPHLFMVTEDSGFERVIQVNDAGEDVGGERLIAVESGSGDGYACLRQPGRLLLSETAGPVFAADTLPFAEAGLRDGVVALRAEHRIDSLGGRELIIL